MTFRRRAALAGVAAVVTLPLAGCGSVPLGALESGDGYGKPSSGGSPSFAPGNGVPGNGAPVAVTGLRVAATGPLGNIVVDSAGRTLYRYDRDRPRPSFSACAADCARMWPPVRWGPRVRATGTGMARLGRVRRADGTFQLTLNGWPMYRHARDTAPGDVNGQGMGNLWFATKPGGAKAGFIGNAPVPPGYGAGTGGVLPGGGTSGTGGAGPGTGGTPSTGGGGSSPG